MSKMYNILWIDDEWDKMTTFMQECDEVYNLHLIPFRTRREGIEELEKNIDKWHAVLLDAKMFDESVNEVATLQGLGKAKTYLDRLSAKKTIPYFISTGQPDLLDDNNFKALFGNFYQKSKDDEKLMKDMVAAIENLESLQIKALYQQVFSSIESMQLSNYVDSILLDILLPLHYPQKQAEFKPIHHYSQLRKLVEYLFRACQYVGLIPDYCIPGGNVNLNQCSLYLAGKNAEKVGVRFGEPGERVLPEYIESIIRSVLEFGNIHSHTVELDCEDALKVEGILNTSRSSYIIFGLTLQMCEVICWLAAYIKTNNDKTKNLSKCVSLSNKEVNIVEAKRKYEGKIFIPTQDCDGIWHCGECLVAITHWSFEQMKLVEISLNTSKKSMNKYPFFAKFEKFNN